MLRRQSVWLFFKESQQSSNPIDLKSGGEEIKKVDKFRYLGSMITYDAKDITTVKTQIAKAKSHLEN